MAAVAPGTGLLSHDTRSMGTRHRAPYGERDPVNDAGAKRRSDMQVIRTVAFPVLAMMLVVALLGGCGRADANPETTSAPPVGAGDVIDAGAPIVLLDADGGSPGAVSGVHHTVERGDTLYDIALRYGVSVDSLVQMNAIEDPALIFPGQLLIVSR